MKALVVEPSKMYQSLLKEFLNGYSISYTLVSTGDDALAELNKESVDIIISAMSLADTSATELAQQIKSQVIFVQTPFVIMTGGQDKNKLQQMKTLDVNYVCQRHDVNQLKNILSELTQHDLTFSKVSGHVLYIEDHLSIANMTMDIFKKMGLTFEHSNSAEQGLELFDKSSYDLVLLDIVLAGKKDGIEMIEEIRGRDDDKKLTPILAISSLIFST